MNPAQPVKAWQVMLALGSLAFTAFSGSDLYIPSLPDMPEVFNTTETLVQMTLSIYMVGFAIACLVIGPLTDYFGYRTPVTICLLAFTAASIGCTYSDSITEFLGWRLLQGITISIEGATGLSLISKLFQGRQRIRMLSIFGMVVAVGPVVAPIIGGYIAVLFDWRATFVVLTGAALVTLVMCLLWLPDVDSEEPPPPLKRLMHGYGSLLRNRQFLRYTILATQIELGMFAFISAGPFLYIEHYGVAQQHFGYFLGGLIAIFALTAMFLSKLNQYFSVAGLIRTGTVLMLLGPLVCFALIAAGLDSPFSLTLALGLAYAGVAPTYTFGQSLAIEVVALKHRGTASAAITASFLLMAGISSLVVSQFNPRDPTVLAIMYLVAAVVAIVTALPKITAQPTPATP